MPISAISPHHVIFLHYDLEIWHLTFGSSVILSPGNATELVSPDVLTEVDCSTRDVYNDVYGASDTGEEDRCGRHGQEAAVCEASAR